MTVVQRQWRYTEGLHCSSAREDCGDTQGGVVVHRGTVGVCKRTRVVGGLWSCTGDCIVYSRTVVVYRGAVVVYRRTVVV